jgi:hypothetical protein
MSALRHQEVTSIHCRQTGQQDSCRTILRKSTWIDTDCLDGELAASDLTAKHKDWISRLITARFAPASIGQSLTAAWSRDMTPLPRFSTVPVPRCEDTDIMVRKDAVLLVQPMVFYALSKDQLPVWSALHTSYPSKFLKSTPISRERAGPHSRLPTKCIPISPAIPDKPASGSPSFHKRAVGSHLLRSRLPLRHTSIQPPRFLRRVPRNRSHSRFTVRHGNV